MEKPSQMIWQQPPKQHQQHQQQHQPIPLPPRSQIKRRRKATLPPLALRNLGNTCYLNSVLQCLTYTPPLANFCLNSRHSSLCSSPPNCPFCLLEKRISRSLTFDQLVDSPVKIHSCLTVFSDHFRCNRQEDAHEFLRYVIDACHNACVRINKLKPFKGNGNVSGGGGGGEKTIVKEIFGGELRSQVKCMNCGGESNKMDEIMDISLDLFQINSVKDALQRFFQPEVLNGTNKYKCDSCAKLVVAKKQMSIMKAPNVLVIQLKRFEGIHGGKIDRAISFEECLVLSNFMCKESQDPHPEYNLFGTIVHSGYSPESGHYYAYIKDGLGRWYCCNDSIVSLSTLQEVLSEKVYILFFTRTNQRPHPTKSSSVTNGVKPPRSNGSDAQKQKEAVPLKSVHSSANVIPTISKNGEVPSSSKIKFGNLKSFNSKELHVNGNGINNGEVPSSSRMMPGNLKSSDSKENHGNGNITDNGYVKNHINVNKVKDVEKTVKERPLVAKVDNATVNKSPNVTSPETKLLLPQGNGRPVGSNVKLMKTEKFEDGGGHQIPAKGRRLDSGIVSKKEDSPAVSGSKRKVLDAESPDRNHSTVEKIDGVLEKDASSYLRSCGWYDEVYSFMLAKKKLCSQAGAKETNDIEIRKTLIEEARKTFLPQIPVSLKAHLCASLKSFHERRQSDA